MRKSEQDLAVLVSCISRWDRNRFLSASIRAQMYQPFVPLRIPFRTAKATPPPLKHFHRQHH